MMLKWIGAIIIFCACAGAGYGAAAAHKREEKLLNELHKALDHMEWELQYRLTTLPELCRQAAQITSGNLSKLFRCLSRELDSQIAPDVSRCLDVSLSQCGVLPPLTSTVIQSLGNCLGRYDLMGQVKGLCAAKEECRMHLECYSRNKDVRLRSYQTLGICAGAALVILFI